jgi:hypothetical protein
MPGGHEKKVRRGKKCWKKSSPAFWKFFIDTYL